MGNKSFWKRGFFDVPSGTPDERVQFGADKYIRRFCTYLEREGYIVYEVTKPVPTGMVEHLVFTEPDTTRYEILARIARPPQELHFDIPDYAVPEMEKIGLVLAE